MNCLQTSCSLTLITMTSEIPHSSLEQRQLGDEVYSPASSMDCTCPSRSNSLLFSGRTEREMEVVFNICLNNWISCFPTHVEVLPIALVYDLEYHASCFSVDEQRWEDTEREREIDADRESAVSLAQTPLSLCLSPSLGFALGSVLMGPSVSINMVSCNTAKKRHTHTNHAINTHTRWVPDSQKLINILHKPYDVWFDHLDSWHLFSVRFICQNDKWFIWLLIYYLLMRHKRRRFLDLEYAELYNFTKIYGRKKNEPFQTINLAISKLLFFFRFY